MSKSRRGDYTSWAEAPIVTPDGEKPRGHLLMAILNYRREIDHLVSDAIEQAYWSLHIHHKWLVTKALYLGSADVADSRNLLVSQFYFSNKYSHMLCIDGDVSWELGTVERLISHPVDLVLGAYPKRADGEGFPVKFLDRSTPVMVDPLTGEQDNKNGLVKLMGGPAGLLLFKREAIEKMVEAYPERWYHHPKVMGGKALSLFEFEVLDHKRHSEDMNFCRLWRECGGDVWCDPHLKLHHHGDKTYSGTFADEMRLIAPAAPSAKIIKIPA